MHDHGQSTAAYVVVEGTLVETATVLGRAAAAARRRVLPEGACRALRSDVVSRPHRQWEGAGPLHSRLLSPHGDKTFYEHTPGQRMQAVRTEYCGDTEVPAFGGIDGLGWAP